MHALLIVGLLSAIAGGGVYAALKGLFGANLEAKAKADEAAFKAALAKFKATATADEQAVVAKIEAVIAAIKSL